MFDLRATAAMGLDSSASQEGAQRTSRPRLAPSSKETSMPTIAAMLLAELLLGPIARLRKVRRHGSWGSTLNREDAIKSIPCWHFSTAPAQHTNIVHRESLPRLIALSLLPRLDPIGRKAISRCSPLATSHRW